MGWPRGPRPGAGGPQVGPRGLRGRGAVRARPGGLDDFGIPRGTRRVGRDGVDEERSPLLRWLENYLRGVARGQRVASHPLYLPVPVPTLSYERRVFACASPSSLRPSQLLGSLHNSAYSRSGGPSKTAIPSQRAAKTLHNVDHEASRTFDRLLPRRELPSPLKQTLGPTSCCQERHPWQKPTIASKSTPPKFWELS